MNALAYAKKYRRRAVERLEWLLREQAKLPKKAEDLGQGIAQAKRSIEKYDAVIEASPEAANGSGREEH